MKPINKANPGLGQNIWGLANFLIFWPTLHEASAVV